MTIFDNYEVWFVIGSQHLYGPETLRQVTQHAEHVVKALNTEAKLLATHYQQSNLHLP